MERASTFQRSEPEGPPPADLYWTCPKCGPIEPKYLPLNPGRWIRRSCACEIATRAKFEEKAKKDVWIATYRKRCYHGWLGEKWANTRVIEEACACTFATYNFQRFPREIYQKTLAFAQKPTGNLILYGDAGRGKTHAAYMIANYLREETAPVRAGYYGIPGLFTTETEFFMAHDSAKKSFDADLYHRIMTQAMEAPILFFDDIGKTPPKEAHHEAYFTVFDARYAAKLPTVISTNKMERLHEFIGEYSVDRLLRGMKKIAFTGTSYRMQEQ